MSKSLEALGKIKKLYKSYIDKIGLGARDIMGFDFSIMEIEKELKALEIIKNKIVLIDVLVDVETENANDYNKFVSKSKNRHLTQEEFDLLKEVGL